MDADGYHSTEHLARKLLVTLSYGGDPASHLAELRQIGSGAGGFGELLGYGASPIDTAFALEALAAAGDFGQETGAALQYLLSTQGADGGWQAGVNETSVYVTALAAQALVPLKGKYTGVSAALSRAEAFLLEKRLADGTWGGRLDTIQVLMALIPGMVDARVLQTSVAALQSAQSADGSWDGDVYITAQALRALAYYNMRTANPPDASSAAIVGRVVTAGSNAPLAGATALISELPGTSVRSDLDGSFAFPGLAPGRYTVVVTKGGYDALSLVVDVEAGQIYQAGTFALSVTGTEGVISGVVTDTGGGVLPNVSVTLGTPEPRQTLTDGAGLYELASLPPGNYKITFAKTGFSTVTGQVSIFEGQVTTINVPLAPEGTYDDRPGDISATVLDGDTGRPVAGATFQLMNGSSAITDDTGRLLIPSVPRGTYEATLGAAGYQSLMLTLLFPPSASGDLGTITLYSVVSESAPKTLTINGTIIDATSAAPVAGATVADVEGGTVVVCDAAGHFVLEGLTSTTVTLGVSAPGYNSVTFTLTSSGFGSTQVSLPLTPADETPPAEPTLFTAAGTVVDADSGTPLSGISVASDGRTVQTGSDGRFVLSNLPDSHVSLTFSSSGYISVDVQADLAPSTVTELGQIRLHPQGSSLPDLTLAGLDTSAAATDPDTLAYSGTISVTVANLGTAPLIVPVGVLAFYDNDANGTYSETTDAYLGEVVTESTVGAGAEQAVHIPVAGGLPFRDAPIRVMVDWKNEVAEAEEHNNAITSSSLCAITPRQDLTASLLSVTAFAGEHPELRVRIGNAGADESSASTAMFYEGDPMAGGTLIGSKPIEPLAPDSYRDITFEDTAAMKGTKAVYAVVDIEGLVPECNEGNNVVSAPAPKLRPDLAFSAVDRAGALSDPETFKTTGHVTAKVQNKGTLDVTGGVALLAFSDTDSNGAYDEGIDVVLGRTAIAAGIPVGSEVVTDIDVNGFLPFRDAGIWVWADSQQEIEEASETNNFGTSALACLITPPAPGQFQLKTKWHWHGPKAKAGADMVFGPIMVGQLSDDNADGKIDTLDTPDLVFVSYPNLDTPILNAVSGKDGSEIWSRSADVTTLGSVALADIDGDGVVEIITSNNSRTSLRAFEHNGATKWFVPLGPASGRPRDGIAVADLDKNGSPEIVIGRRAYSNTGKLLWEGNKDYGGYSNYGTLSIVADIDMSGTMEVIAGRTVYNADGTVKWHNQNLYYDGFNAVGNFDGDAYPEIVLVTYGRVYLLEHTGQIKWGPFYIPGGGYGGAPTVADFDGDGAPEIGVAGSSNYVVIETNGKLKWASKTTDYSSSRTGSSVFDFEGDGRAEVLYGDERNFYVYDGLTGKTLVKLQNNSGTTFEYPTVADVDDDGEAEIMIAGNVGNWTDGVRVLEAASGHWRNTRRIWNQHSYHITNINDDGTVPADEVHSWQAHNTYRLNTFLGVNPLSSPDLTVGRLTVTDDGSDGVTLSAKVGNGGIIASPNGVKLAFYAGDPKEGGTLLGTSVVASMQPDGHQDVSLSIQAGYDGSQDLYAFVDSDDKVAECNELNNTVSLPGSDGAAQLGSITVATDSAIYAPQMPVTLSGTVLNSGSLVGDYSAELRLEDVNGQLVAAYAAHSVTDLQSAAQAVVTDAWNTGRYLAGVYRLRGKVFNNAGKLLDEAVTTFEIRHDPDAGLALTLRTRTDRPSYNTTDTVVVDDLVSNVTESTLFEAGTLRLTVKDPAGADFYQVDVPLMQLAPGGQTQVPTSYRFGGAMTGYYNVAAKVLDHAGTVLAEASTAYEVKEDLLRTLTGEVKVTYPELHQGEPQICNDTVQNRGTLDIATQRIRHVVVSLASEAVLVDAESQIALAAGGTETLVNSVSTDGFDLGDYACVLQGEIQGAWQTLGYDTFRLLPPPIRIEASASLGTRGRLLVLLDDGSKAAGGDGGDAHGPQSAPDAYDQWAFLEETLINAGWSYSIVSNAETFTRELRSGGYAVYLLLEEQEKLPNEVQKELREAVFRGEGLVVAGDHDQRNAWLDSALGVKYVGKVSGATDVGWWEPLSATGQSVLTVSPQVERVAAQAALVAGSFNTGTPAVTVNDFGEGKAIYVAFDLLAETTADEGAGQLDELLLTALEHVHPETLEPVTRGVVPLRLNLVNEGIATPGRVTLALPDGVQVVDPGTAQFSESLLAWLFDLPEAGMAEFSAWLRLPSVAGPITFSALLETGTEGAFVPYGEVALAVDVAEARTTAEAYDLLAADLEGGGDQTLKQAARLLETALKAEDDGRIDDALRGMVETCDLFTESRYDLLHKAIADALWTLGTEWRP